LTCVGGAIWDVYVDLRKNSETYGFWGAEFLSPKDGKSVLISEGIGHAFLALKDETIVNYLCTSEYNPDADRTINPLDPVLSIPFLRTAEDFGISELLLSQKDKAGWAFREL
jgi:dTDP-4-dehydrorhamnose 3,5-epimerase